MQTDAAHTKELTDRSIALGREQRAAQATADTASQDLQSDQALLGRLKGKPCQQYTRSTQDLCDALESPQCLM